MSETMKQAHELAPFVADALRAVALRAVADEADYPDGTDSREWTEAEHAAHQFAVDIAEAALTDDVRRGNDLIDELLAHAEAARDAALEEKHD